MRKSPTVISGKSAQLDHSPYDHTFTISANGCTAISLIEVDLKDAKKSLKITEEANTFSRTHQTTEIGITKAT